MALFDTILGGGAAYNDAIARSQALGREYDKRAYNADKGQSGVRSQQEDLARQLSGLASGRDQSAAQLLLGQAQEQNAQAAQSLAGSARGGNVGLAQYQAANKAAEANQAAAYQAALMRAQEQANWYNMYGNALGGMRGQDLSALGMNTNAELSALGQQSAATGVKYGADAQRDQNIVSGIADVAGLPNRKSSGGS